MIRLLLILTAAIWLSSCSDPEREPVAGIAFVGEVRHVDLEGGFYGIVTTTGERLLPETLPLELRHDGLAVTGRYRLHEDVVTIQQWGRAVELLTIQRRERPTPTP